MSDFETVDAKEVSKAVEANPKEVAEEVKEVPEKKGIQKLEEARLSHSILNVNTDRPRSEVLFDLGKSVVLCFGQKSKVMDFDRMGYKTLVARFYPSHEGVQSIEFDPLDPIELPKDRMVYHESKVMSRYLKTLDLHLKSEQSEQTEKEISLNEKLSQLVTTPPIKDSNERLEERLWGDLIGYPITYLK